MISIATLLILAAGLAQVPPAPAGPLPISAHHCYPQNGQGQNRLTEALGLGIDNIEIDVGWDADRGRLIVGHDAKPQPGVAYPEFEAYLVPALEAHWRHPRPDGAPTVLTIDWKTSEPAAVRWFHGFLDAHADWFSSAIKAPDGTFTPRRLTVCLSGSEEAKDFYDSLIPPGSHYRAFRDRVYGAGAPYQADLTRYAPDRASTYYRFLALYWGHVERGGPPRAGDWTPVDAERLKGLVDRAHAQGLRIRFYTLNGHSGRPLDSYRFPDDAAAQTRWKAARDAGADWVATDEYADIVRVFSPKSTR